MSWIDGRLWNKPHIKPADSGWFQAWVLDDRGNRVFDPGAYFDGDKWEQGVKHVIVLAWREQPTPDKPEWVP